MLINPQIKILQFSSKHCPPCFAIKQKILDWLQTHHDIEYQSILIEDSPDMAAKEGIFSVPAILVFVEGKLTIREVGYFSLNAVFSQIEHYINLLNDTIEP